MSELTTASLDELTIDDHASFRHVALHRDLEEVVRRAKIGFRILPDDGVARLDRATFLNLTYWSAAQGGDVLVSRAIDADVVAHVAWHHLACRALSPDAQATAAAMFFGEAIASAFDLYLVGRLLGHAPRSSFLETQVPAMADAADAAGLDEAGFERLLESIAEGPDRAFEDLRALLFDATTALYACDGAESALAALCRFDGHRFASLLHHYQLSNWVLYARAHARPQASAKEGDDAEVHALDATLRAAPSSIEWLERAWVAPSVR